VRGERTGLECAQRVLTGLLPPPRSRRFGRQPVDNPQTCSHDRAR